MAPRATPSKHRSRLAPIGALLLLCLLRALGPLRSELLPASWSNSWSNSRSNSWPGSLPPLATQAIPLGLAAILTAVFAGWHRAEWPRSRHLRSAIWIGLGLFPVPALLLYLASGSVSGLASTALLALVPVFCVVLEPHLGRAAEQPIPGALVAALAALLGTLLVYPVAMPVSTQAALSLAAVIAAAICLAAANCYAAAALYGHSLRSAAPIVATATLPAALGLGLASLILEVSDWQRTQSQLSSFLPELLWALTVELPSLLLLFRLMQRLSAVRLATRFLLVPLFVVPAGALLLQIPLAPRTCLGLLVMAASTAYLLFAREPVPPATTLLGNP